MVGKHALTMATVSSTIVQMFMGISDPVEALAAPFDKEWKGCAYSWGLRVTACG